MRTAGLVVLAILILPTSTHAADPPALTTYTISQDTIYPSAEATSGLATTTTIDIAFSETVKVSIKILSANGALFKSLYSNTSGVKNPDPKIWDGANATNGTYTILISATSTATGIPMTDSSKTITAASPGDSAPPDVPPDTIEATTGEEVSSSGGGPAEYLPIPTLRIISSGARTVSSGADTAFTAAVYDGKGNRRDDAIVTWSFGDGMRRTGASVFHKYYDPGEYMTVVHAVTSDGGDARSETLIAVKNAGIKIASVSSRGITLANNDSRTLDLSLWRLSMGGKEFKIPEDTHILAGHTILYPSQVIELPFADSASLLYPSGEVAAAYPSAVPATAVLQQPPPKEASYKKVSEVEPTTSARANTPAHDEAVEAPAAANELAAAGAAMPPAPVSRIASLLKSPWTIGFLSVLAFAGGAFIFL